MLGKERKGYIAKGVTTHLSPARGVKRTKVQKTVETYWGKRRERGFMKTGSEKI